MRPETFEAFLVQRCRRTPAVQRVRTFEEAGDLRHPYGLVVTVDGHETRWHIVGQIAAGEDHDVPAPPVQGRPAAYTPTRAGTDDDWLAAVIAAGESPEIQQIKVWSASPRAQPGHVGLTVRFHNGQRAFIRKLLPGGSFVALGVAQVQLERTGHQDGQ
ncbi:hypothetical protein ACIQI8_27655 [Streptomyces sp. NPDC092369]|uniref:hypothetical protein n=1 Tax=Streptomyces sp. NPDC092369 TaxID=3366015 RepID=UPI003819560A